MQTNLKETKQPKRNRIITKRHKLTTETQNHYKDRQINRKKTTTNNSKHSAFLLDVFILCFEALGAFSHASGHIDKGGREFQTGVRGFKSLKFRSKYRIDSEKL